MIQRSLLLNLLRGALPLWTATALFLTGCQGYDFTINERVVYSPKPLFSDFEVADAALHTCLTETIQHSSIQTAEELTALNCSHAGIKKLDGLATFSALEILHLGSNNIRNLVELTALPFLIEVQLQDNDIIDAVPLFSLANLAQLDLSDNAAMQCPSAELVEKIETVRLPEHCQ